MNSDRLPLLSHLSQRRWIAFAAPDQRLLVSDEVLGIIETKERAVGFPHLHSTYNHEDIRNVSHSHTSNSGWILITSPSKVSRARWAAETKNGTAQRLWRRIVIPVPRYYHE